MPSIQPDRQLVARYTATAAADLLAMIENGTVKVGDRTVHIRNFRQAKQVKLGKLSRHLGFIVRLSPNPRSVEHKRTVATWQSVARHLERATSQAAVEKLAARKRLATRARAEAR